MVDTHLGETDVIVLEDESLSNAEHSRAIYIRSTEFTHITLDGKGTTEKLRI